MQIINTLVKLIGMCACKHSYFQKEISLVWWFWTKLIAESLYSIFSIFLFFFLCYSFPPFPSPQQKIIFLLQMFSSFSFFVLLLFWNKIYFPSPNFFPPLHSTKYLCTYQMRKCLHRGKSWRNRNTWNESVTNRNCSKVHWSKQVRCRRLATGRGGRLSLAPYTPYCSHPFTWILFPSSRICRKCHLHFFNNNTWLVLQS